MDLKVCINGKIGFVNKKEYIKAKANQLKEFGYSSLTEKEVRLQIDNIIKGNPISIIGMFMKDEVII